MKYNKTTFNYIIWGLLCILTFAGIGVCAIGVSESMQNESYLLFVGAFYAIFLVVCTVLIVGFRALKNALDGKVDFSKYRVEGILETVLVFAVIIAAMIIRLSLTVSRLTDGAGVTVINGSHAYFDYAVGNIDAIGTGTNGAYLYAGILRGVLSLFGENIIMIYVLQAVFTLGIITGLDFTFSHCIPSRKHTAFYVLYAGTDVYIPGKCLFLRHCNAFQGIRG